MHPKYRHLVIEGIDRLGKSSLIQSILQNDGYHFVIHYQKPQKLEFYNQDTNPILSYQVDSFCFGIDLLKSEAPTIFDRFHLGEAVYSHRYRNYSGKYVFDLEKRYGLDYCTETKLILLMTSDFSFITDDGDSFDVTKREEEQDDFIEAFFSSILPNKVMIDVCNGKGGFKTLEEIYEEAVA